jgi:hypothetical protein
MNIKHEIKSFAWATGVLFGLIGIFMSLLWILGFQFVNLNELALAFVTGILLAMIAMMIAGSMNELLFKKQKKWHASLFRLTFVLFQICLMIAVFMMVLK